MGSLTNELKATCKNTIELDKMAAIYEWTEPENIFEPPKPKFPVEAFPEFYQKFISAFCEFMQITNDMAGIALLSVWATALQRKMKVEAAPDWLQELCLYLIVLLPPSERKSDTLNGLIKPIINFEERIQDQERVKVEESKAYYKTLQKRRENLSTKLANKGNDHQTLNEFESVNREIAEKKPKELTRILYDDCTPEALARKMINHGEAAAILASECTFLENVNRYASKGRNGNSGLLLHGFNGERTTVDRSKDDFFGTLKRPVLTVCLFVQQVAFDGVFDEEARGKGLLARFCLSVPPTLKGHRKIKVKPVEEQLKQEYVRRINNLLEIENRETEPYVIKMSKEAQEVFENFREEVEREQGDFGRYNVNADISEFAGKCAGITARIAGLLHCAKEETSKPWQTLINSQTVHGAIRIAKYFLAHAEGYYAGQSSNEELAWARKVLKWLVVQKAAVTVRNAWQHFRWSIKDIEKFYTVLDFLEETANIRSVNIGITKPSIVIEVNPMLKIENQRKTTQITQNLEEEERFESIVWSNQEIKNVMKGEL